MRRIGQVIRLVVTGCCAPQVGLHSNVEVWRHGVRTCNLCNSQESPWCSLHKLQVLMPCLHLHVRILVNNSFADGIEVGSHEVIFSLT